jgi:hypothetical protein
MNETAMRKSVRDKALKEHPTSDWCRLESWVGIGVPDINWCVDGMELWIEGKCIPPEAMPKRTTTALHIGLRPEQRLWLEKRQRAGGNVCVLALLGKEWFIFRENFGALLEKQTLEDLRMISTHHWTGPFDVQKLLR